MNFPSRHPLNQSFRRAVIGQADVILGLEMNDLWGTLNALHRPHRAHARIRPPSRAPRSSRSACAISTSKPISRISGASRTSISPSRGDGEASLPALTEAVKRLIDAGRKSAYEARGKKLAAAHLAMVEQSKTAATIGWDASPISTARLCAEVYAQIKDEDWSLVGTSIRL